MMNEIQYIAGYEDLRDLRRQGRAPATPILITDSEVIEGCWSELFGSHFQPLIAEVPPCSVLRIRNEPEHELSALRGLKVALLLVRNASRWVTERARSAHPEVLATYLHGQAYDACFEFTARLRETWEERAAIIEFDGGLTRQEAETKAWEQVSGENWLAIITSAPVAGSFSTARTLSTSTGPASMTLRAAA